MALYKCKKCGWGTTDEAQLVLVKGCCGSKKYKCRNCGYSDVAKQGEDTPPANNRIMPRTTTGFGGKITYTKGKK